MIPTAAWMDLCSPHVTVMLHATEASNELAGSPLASVILLA